MTQHPTLVTGAAGFIGFHASLRLLADGHAVVGFDNLNSYYDPELKKARLRELSGNANFEFFAGDLSDETAVSGLFARYEFPHVLHLAAQPGVRYSITNPQAYARSNLDGFLNIIEGCRQARSAHLVYASSSSVYGANTHLPWRADDIADHPLSLYGATKRANELMAHSYAHLFGIPMSGLRFFTVYGPWGRPDMAVWLFTDAIINGRPIQLFNQGEMLRDFTYVDDVVEAIARLIKHPAAADPSWSGARPNPASSTAPWHVYNIGNSRPIPLKRLVQVIEEAVGRPAVCEYLPMQPGDVPETSADCTDLERAVGFRPNTPIEDGVRAFVKWFRTFYRYDWSAIASD